MRKNFFIFNEGVKVTAIQVIYICHVCIPQKNMSNSDSGISLNCTLVKNKTYCQQY